VTQPFTESIKEKTFGKERFELGSQLFRSFFLNYLLKLTFFGCNFSKLHQNEIVYRTNKAVVVHISSHQWIVELFTHNGVCVFEFSSDEGEKKRISCGGKVVLKQNHERYKESIGYVLKEDVGKLSIKTEIGDVVEMIKPETFN
jgi:RNase P/RNase MRP subunit p29